MGVYSQDVIILMKKDSLKVVVTKVTTEDVEFHYSKESLTNVISKKTINKIIFGNGRVEVCHERKVYEWNDEEEEDGQDAYWRTADPEEIPPSPPPES